MQMRHNCACWHADFDAGFQYPSFATREHNCNSLASAMMLKDSLPTTKTAGVRIPPGTRPEVSRRREAPQNHRRMREAKPASHGTLQGLELGAAHTARKGECSALSHGVLWSGLQLAVDYVLVVKERAIGVGSTVDDGLLIRKFP
jgi:hypothetical protein